VTLHRVTGGHPPAERQILAAISASPSGRTEILLDPQELGRVRVSLEGDESALVLTIQADRVDTADLLRRNADLLVQEFREAGYQNLTFSFSDQSRDTADQKSAGPDFGTDDTPLSADLVADLSPRRTALGGLDLRL
jgi:flagellar hook-length control protein FliK